MSANKNIIYRTDYQQPNYWIRSVDLAFVVESDNTLVTSRLQFIKNPNQQHNDLFLDGINLTLLAIELNEEVLEPNAYQLSDSGLTLNNLPDENQS